MLKPCCTALNIRYSTVHLPVDAGLGTCAVSAHAVVETVHVQLHGRPAVSASDLKLASHG